MSDFVCKSCQKPKDASRFRVRVKRGYKYRLHTCLDCECDKQKERYKKYKNNPDFKRLNVERANRYRTENWSVIREKDQHRRQTESYKANRKRYIAENKEKIREQERVTKRRYHVKNRDNLSDVYVISKVVGKSRIERDKIHPALVKLKRIQLIAIRTIKQKTHEPR